MIFSWCYTRFSVFLLINPREIIYFAVKLILQNKKKDFIFWKTNQLKWFILLRYKHYFYFYGKVSDKVDGVAVGFPLESPLTNFFTVSN